MNKIYIINSTQLNNDDIFQKYYRNMSDYRKQKINKLKFRDDKNRSISAGILIDNFLKQKGLCEKDIIFDTSENGKPFFKDYPNLFFNLSHSGDYAICVFSDKEVGCDIEKISGKHIDIAKRILTTDELDKLNSAEDPEKKCEMFFRFWTLKESYLKYLGKGLSKSMNSFEFNFDKSDNPHLIDKEQLKEIFLYENSVEGYKISVCSENNTFSKKLNHIILS